MAGVFGILEVTDEALGAAAAETVLQLEAAANHRVLVWEWGVSFAGVVNTDESVQVDCLRQTDDGTSDALTATKMNEGDNETLQTAGRHNVTVEPTTGENLHPEKVHPQGGYTWVAPPGRPIVVIGGNRVAIRCNAPDAVDCSAWFKFEE